MGKKMRDVEDMTKIIHPIHDINGQKSLKIIHFYPNFSYGTNIRHII